MKFPYLVFTNVLNKYKYILSCALYARKYAGRQNFYI